MSDMFTFVIVKGGGSHFDKDREYTEGQQIITSDNLQEIFPGKFMLVDKANVTPTTPPMDFAKGGAVATPPVKPPAADAAPKGNAIVPPKGVGLSAKRAAGNKYTVTRDDTGEVIAKGVSKRDAKDLCNGETITIAEG